MTFRTADDCFWHRIKMQNTMNGTIVVALCNANYKWRGTS